MSQPRSCSIHVCECTLKEGREKGGKKEMKRKKGRRGERVKGERKRKRKESAEIERVDFDCQRGADSGKYFQILLVLGMTNKSWHIA